MRLGLAALLINSNPGTSTDCANAATDSIADSIRETAIKTADDLKLLICEKPINTSQKIWRCLLHRLVFLSNYSSKNWKLLIGKWHSVKANGEKCLKLQEMFLVIEEVRTSEFRKLDGKCRILDARSAILRG
jgi:hypothetical protein